MNYSGSDTLPACEGLSRRDFLVRALLTSGAVVMGSSGLVPVHASPAAPSGWPAEWPTPDLPLVVDVPSRTVKMYAELSLEHLTRTTGHWGIGCRSGTLADRFILVSPADPLDFHDALIRVGARPGNNLEPDSYGRHVTGDALAVTVSWPGLRAPLDLKEIFHDETGRGFAIRFGGNREAARKHRTGCLTCLESCPVGITSNAAYPHISGIQRSIMPNSRFRGRPEALPRKDAFPLAVCYRLEAKG